MPEGALRLVTRGRNILLRADEKFLQHAGEFEKAWPQFLKQLSQTPQGRGYRLRNGGIREAVQRSAQLPDSSSEPGERGNNPFNAADGPEDDAAGWQRRAG